MSELASSIKVQSNEDRIPVVSVLMPVHNGGKYLAEAVESILNQTFRDFEFLILDDGSTDESLKLLRQYAKKDSRLQVISRKNRGLTFTLNELLSYARGEFVARMDADDVSFPDRFDRQVAFLKENHKVVCVGGASQMIDSAGRYLTTLLQPQTDVEIQTLVLGGHGAITHPSAMMRNTSLKLVGGYDEKYNTAEDLDLWLRLGEVGELANLPDVLLKYRLHDKSISEISGQGQRDTARRACENAWRRRGIAGVFSADALWRPSTDRSSRYTFMLKYGWWAWNNRQRKTAAFYGWQAIKMKPLSLDGWKLLMVSLIKPLEIVERDSDGR
jgi:glycosyltransferase involved in cell wall biosynthesis